MFRASPRWHKYFLSDCPLTQALGRSATSATISIDFLAAALATAQNYTNSFLSTSSKREVAQPFTQACDEFFSDELFQLNDTFPAREAALLACAHLLRYPQAQGQLLLTKRAVDADHFVNDRLVVYLQCLVLANAATNGDVVSDVQAAAATDLLMIPWEPDVDADTAVPSVWSLLGVVSSNVSDAYFPLWFAEMVLARTRYWQRLMTKLHILRRQRRWEEAYNLVSGLHDISSLNQPASNLLESFPERAIWASWRPNLHRLRLWSAKRRIIEPHLQHLGSILDLEGPDTTGNTLPTLTHSTTTSFHGTTLPSPSFLDQLLLIFDQTLSHSSDALSLYLTLTSSSTTPLTLSRLTTALALPSASIETLNNFLHQLANPTPSQPSTRRDETLTASQLSACAAVLPLLRTNLTLQSPFGHHLDLSGRLFDILRNAQIIFNGRIADPRKDASTFAVGIAALGKEMADAAWLRTSWVEGYLTMLRGIPTVARVKGLMSTLVRVRKADDRSKEKQIVEALKISVGGVKPEAGASLAGAVHVEEPHPIMVAELDADRTALREMLTKVPRLSAKLAAECVRQAGRESDLFVRELASLLEGGDTDQTCCNVAEILGMRGTAGECWKALLLHMMKVRPRGILERRAGDRNVSSAAWGRWLESLRRVFGERELEVCLGGLGFTGEAIRSFSARKMGVGRMDSTSTVSTTGSYR